MAGEHESDLDRRSEFMDLVTPNQSRLFGYIYALVHDSNDAHDVYQQTVMTLWRKFDTFEPGSNFGAWALRSAQLECLAFRRRSCRERFCFDADLVAKIAEAQTERQDWGAASERAEALNICLRKLQSKDRSLLDDCYRQEARIRDVAEQLGRTSQSVCNSLRRVRMALLRCVDQVLAHGGQP